MAGNPHETGQAVFGLAMTDAKIAETLQIPHQQLLHEAFDALTGQLDRQGYTGRFNHLRHIHSKKILEYWAAKKAQFEALSGENGGSITVGHERIEMIGAERYEDEDDKVLRIIVRDPHEKSSFSMTVNTMLGLDEFMNPPTVESEISLTPGGAPDYYYKAVFRNQRISTFTRTKVMPALGALGELGGYMKDTRVIDCSIFGVETR